MNAIVINCSAPYYNLGAHKIADWLSAQGNSVTVEDGRNVMMCGGYDAVYLSVIFSWHAPLARDIAMMYDRASIVECGGPGMFALRRWWKSQTGRECHVGLDERFERQRGDYKMTFASRGCPVNCWFCIVPKLEGTAFTLDWRFNPAPILCDNNISALPVDFQNHIIERYEQTGTRLLDANSGFEPRTFDGDTYERWRRTLKGPWRFALDTSAELPDVERMMGVLKDVSPRRKQVYVLIGNEPYDACMRRIRKVIEWGGEPYCQPVMPLNALDRSDLIVRHDWTSTQLKRVQRWTNRHVWRTVPFEEYIP